VKLARAIIGSSSARASDTGRSILKKARAKAPRREKEAVPLI